MDKRSNWVDYAKGVGILLVVYGHVMRGLVNANLLAAHSWYATVDRFIYSFHMPLFFTVAAIFFRASLQRRGYLALVANKWDALIYLYVFWTLFQGSVEVLLSSLTHSALTWSDILAFPVSPRGQFWFLYAMFLMAIVAAALYLRGGKRVALAVLVVSTLGFAAAKTTVHGLHLGFIVAYLPFFALGIAIADWQVLIHRHLVPLTALVLLVAGGLQVVVNFGQQEDYVSGTELGLLVSGCSVLAVVLLCMAADRWEFKTLAHLGRQSMPIFLAHILVASGVRIVMQKGLGIDNLWAHMVMATALGVMLPLLLPHWAPKLGMSWLLECPQRLSLERALQRQRRPPSSPAAIVAAQ